MTTTQLQISVPSIISLPQSYPLVLTSEQEANIVSKLEKMTLTDVNLMDIPTIGSDVEIALGKVLSGFLSGVDKSDNPRIFKLVEELGVSLENEKLYDLSDKILNAKPNWFVRNVVGAFSKKSLANATNKIQEEVRLLASGKSKKLSDVIDAKEKEFAVEQQKLRTEVQKMESLKEEYKNQFRSFVLMTGFMYSLLNKFKEELKIIESDPTIDSVTRAEFQDKVQALESRTLAIEGTMTRLPSDQIVIRQLQNAGVSTLLETSTTVSARFSSIKMTLLTIHGTLVTQGMQRLAESGANLDNNLMRVRSKLLNTTVTDAANAPGKNRLAQAEQLKKIVEESKAINKIVEDARVTNKAAFESSRALFADVRTDLLELGKKTQVNKPLVSF